MLVLKWHGIIVVLCEVYRVGREVIVFNGVMRAVGLATACDRVSRAPPRTPELESSRVIVSADWWIQCRARCKLLLDSLPVPDRPPH